MERAVKGLVDGRFQWVVFTSTNAVRAVWEKFNEFGLDARAFSGVRIACVGQATADRVRAFGINPELVPAGEQSSLGLLDEFPPFDDIFDPVNRVLLPRADIATETLAEGLRERGWEIEDVTAYRTVRAAPPPAQTREMIKTGGFDAVCFTSSSTVRNLVGIAGKPHARTIVACIGPKTAETAAEFGLRVDVQPETAAVGPLVEALAEHAARLRAEGPSPLRSTSWPSQDSGPVGCAPPRHCVGWWPRHRWSQDIWCCRCSWPTASMNRSPSCRCPASCSTPATRCARRSLRPLTSGWVG
jgi:uroporphyrinogen III methyltransferase/synthase